MYSHKCIYAQRQITSLLILRGLLWPDRCMAFSSQSWTVCVCLISVQTSKLRHEADCISVFICYTASDEILINGAEFTQLSSKWNPKGYLGVAHHYFSKIKQTESEASVVVHKIISTKPLKQTDILMGSTQFLLLCGRNIRQNWGPSGRVCPLWQISKYKYTALENIPSLGWFVK